MILPWSGKLVVGQEAEARGDWRTECPAVGPPAPSQGGRSPGLVPAQVAPPLALDRPRV